MAVKKKIQKRAAFLLREQIALLLINKNKPPCIEIE